MEYSDVEKVSMDQDGPEVDAIIYLFIIGAIWSAYLITIYIYYKNAGKKVKNYESLYVVHNKCYSFNARNVYLIKLFYGKPRKKFFFLSTIILEYFDDKCRSLLLLKIPPTLLFDSKKESIRKQKRKSEAKQLAIILQTKKSLSYANEVRVSHTCNAGDLFIYKTKIIDLITKESFISTIQSWIGYLTPGAHDRAQMFVIKQSGVNQTDIKPSPYASIPEMLLFFLVGIHWILFQTQYIISSMKIMGFVLYYKDTETMASTAVVSGAVAFTLSALTLGIYACIIKWIYSEYRGIGIICVIKFIYLFFIVIASLVLGLFAAFKPENISISISISNESYDSSESNQLKWFTVITAIAIHSLIYFILGISCQSFRGTEEVYSLDSDIDITDSSINSSQRTALKTESVQSIKEIRSAIDSKNFP